MNNLNKTNLKDPFVFIEQVLGVKQLTREQKQIVSSVWENRYTGVKSSPSMGKTFISACIVLAFLTPNEQSKVITTAPTARQVEDLLWSEIAQLYYNSRHKIGGKLLNKDLIFAPNWFATGISTQPKREEESAVKMRGYHAPQILVVVDEASGVHNVILEAVDDITSGELSKVLMISNPSTRSCGFYKFCKSPDTSVIEIPCFTHPNITTGTEVIPGAISKSWIKKQIRKHCEQISNNKEEISNNKEEISNNKEEISNNKEEISNNKEEISNNKEEISNNKEEISNNKEEISNNKEEISNNKEEISNNSTEEISGSEFGNNVFVYEGKTYRANPVGTWRLLAKFPETASDTLIDYQKIENAMQRQKNKGAERIQIALDVARFGDDKSVFCINDNLNFSFKSYYHLDTAKLSGKAVKLIKKLKPSRFAVDCDGIGAGVYDNINEARDNGMFKDENGNEIEFELVEIRSAALPAALGNEEQFLNRRAQMFWLLRDDINLITLEKNEELLDGLSSIKYFYNSKGKVQIEEKKDFKARLGRSSDYEDALVYCNFLRYETDSFKMYILG